MLSFWISTAFGLCLFAVECVSSFRSDTMAYCNTLVFTCTCVCTLPFLVLRRNLFTGSMKFDCWPVVTALSWLSWWTVNGVGFLCFVQIRQVDALAMKQLHFMCCIVCYGWIARKLFIYFYHPASEIAVHDRALHLCLSCFNIYSRCFAAWFLMHVFHIVTSRNLRGPVSMTPAVVVLHNSISRPDLGQFEYGTWHAAYPVCVSFLYLIFCQDAIRAIVFYISLVLARRLECGDYYVKHRQLHEWHGAYQGIHKLHHRFRFSNLLIDGTEGTLELLGNDAYPSLLLTSATFPLGIVPLMYEIWLSTEFNHSEAGTERRGTTLFTYHTHYIHHLLFDRNYGFSPLEPEYLGSVTMDVSAVDTIEPWKTALSRNAN